MVAVFSAVLVAAPAWADHDKGHDDHRHGHKNQNEEVHYFHPYDVRVMTPYAPVYRSLPPGLAKKYYRTGELPPGWQKKLRPFPVELERRLAPVPRPYRRGFIDGYAVVYDPRTHIIVDLLRVD